MLFWIRQICTPHWQQKTSDHNATQLHSVQPQPGSMLCSHVFGSHTRTSCFRGLWYTTCAVHYELRLVDAGNAPPVLRFVPRHLGPVHCRLSPQTSVVPPLMGAMPPYIAAVRPEMGAMRARKEAIACLWQRRAP
eukprot:2183788-Rhodomonas_salina.4